MRDDPGDHEIVEVQEDTSKWWQNRTLVIDWRVIGLTALIGLPGLLLALSRAQN
jgi:hypothetical protein